MTVQLIDSTETRLTNGFGCTPRGYQAIGGSEGCA